jgi:hypothetical protein
MLQFECIALILVNKRRK